MDDEVIISPKKLVIAHFPDYEIRINILFEEDESFGELVNDFLYCERELKRLSEKRRLSLANQYQATLNELKIELLEYLKE